MSLDDSTRRARRRRQQHRTRALVGVGALALSTLVFGPAAQGVPIAGEGKFQLDGNALQSLPAGAVGDDWDNVNAASSHGAFRRTGAIADTGPTDRIFTGGASKDDLNIDGWRHTLGSVPDKDDITNAYAAAYSSTSNDLLVMFGLDRFAQNGDANVGFWFLQDDLPATLPTDGTFGMVHTPGDILVLSEFSKGGDVSSIRVLEWVGSGGAINGTLDELYSSSQAQCGNAAAILACGIANAASITSPWSYTPKMGASGSIPKGGFFEGGVNLTDLFDPDPNDSTPGQTPCFSTFLAETRSSTSVDATLKDFVASTFSLCQASISIAPDAVNKVGDPHTFTVRASLTIAGVQQPPPAGTTATVTLTRPSGATVTPTSNTCASPGFVTSGSQGTCTVTFTSSTPGLVVGQATTSFTYGGRNFSLATDGTGGTGNANKRFVDSRILISADARNGIGENHTFTISPQVDIGSGWVAPATADVNVTLSGSGGATPIADLTASTCDLPADEPNTGDNLGTAGTCVVVFTSNTAGTVTAHASATIQLTLTEGSITLTPSTIADDPNASTDVNNDDALKVFVDGTLAWEKHDGSATGPLLGGATFEVCRVSNWVTGTGLVSNVPSGTTEAAYVCPAADRFTVADDTPNNGDPDVDLVPDADADAGEFRLDVIVLGRYRIVETSAPTGYAKDTTPRFVDLTLTSPSNTASPPKFVNERLYRLIVLTCSTVTETLVESRVSVDETPSNTDTTKTNKQTLLPGTLTEAQQAALCGLGGANYDNLRGNTYTAEVELPDVTP